MEEEDMSLSGNASGVAILAVLGEERLNSTLVICDLCSTMSDLFGGDGGANGLPSCPENDSLLQLREDIKKCESEDVRVMWSILTQIQMDGKAEMLLEAEVCTCHPRRRRQNSSRWRLLVLGIQQRI